VGLDERQIVEDSTDKCGMYSGRMAPVPYSQHRLPQTDLNGIMDFGELCSIPSATTTKAIREQISRLSQESEVESATEDTMEIGSG
jgi:hypothetical protein